MLIYSIPSHNELVNQNSRLVTFVTEGKRIDSFPPRYIQLPRERLQDWRKLTQEQLKHAKLGRQRDYAVSLFEFLGRRGSGLSPSVLAQYIFHIINSTFLKNQRFGKICQLVLSPLAYLIRLLSLRHVFWMVSDSCQHPNSC